VDPNQNKKCKQSLHLHRMDCNLALNGKDSFYSNAANIIKNFYPNIEETIDIEKFVQDTNITDFVKTIKDKYTSFWKHQIENSSKL
jgi:hypothetical protein